MKTSTLILTGIIGVLIIVGVIIFVNRPATPISTTTTIITPGTETTTGNQSTAPTSTTTSTTTQVINQQSGIPAVFTSPDAVVTDTTSAVKGAVTPNGAFTNYWYEYGTTSNLSKKTSSELVGSGYSAIGAPGYITGLVKDTTYYFRLVAENQYGRVAGSQATFKTTHGVAAPVGSVPTARTLGASKITGTTANFNGEVNPDRSQTDYWFEYGTTPSLGSITQFLAVGNGSVKTSVFVPVANLIPGTTYYFRLNAQNKFGTVNGSILNFKTSGSTATTAPSVTTSGVTAVKATTASFSGTIVPNDSTTTYWFEYSTDAVLAKRVSSTAHKTASAGTNPIAITADVTKLSSGTTYYVQAVAQNNAGTTRGDRVSFKTE